MSKNYLFIGGTGAVAIGGKDQSRSFNIVNKSSLDEIKDIIRRRQELGRELSEILKKNGVDTAKDEDTVVG